MSGKEPAVPLAFWYAESVPDGFSSAETAQAGNKHGPPSDSSDGDFGAAGVRGGSVLLVSLES